MHKFPIVLGVFSVPSLCLIISAAWPIVSGTWKAHFWDDTPALVTSVHQMCRPSYISSGKSGRLNYFPLIDCAQKDTIVAKRPKENWRFGEVDVADLSYSYDGQQFTTQLPHREIGRDKLVGAQVRLLVDAHDPSSSSRYIIESDWGNLYGISQMVLVFEIAAFFVAALVRYTW